MTTRASKWTKEQLHAIKASSNHILVSAAAGSGKTAVLVERIIRMTVDDENPVDIDRILVVTFTNAAAYEMKTRIASAIEDRIGQESGNDVLAHQALLLHKAPIMTLHAFCITVIREHFSLAGVDPNFRIADETEIELLKREVLDAIFEQSYESDDDFLVLLESFESGLRDDALQTLIFDLYDFLQSLPEPMHALTAMAQRFNLPDKKHLPKTLWQGVQSALKEEITGALEMIKTALALCALPGGPAIYQETLQKDKQWLGALLAAQTYQEAYGILKEAAFGRLKSCKDADEALIEQVKAIRDEVKKAVATVQSQFFFKEEAAIIADIRDCYPVIQTLCGIASEFSAQLFAAKQERGILYFNDLEQLCLKVLLPEEMPDGQAKPSTAALRYQEQFAEVLTDEYQDINLIQEAILSMLTSPDAPNRFMVGDIKQSIYQFRLAKPALFLEKYRRYKQDEQAGTVIDLSQNFRSRQTLLQGINFIFAQIMTEESAGIAYDDNAALHKGLDYPKGDDAISVLLLERAKLTQDGGDWVEDETINDLGTAQLEIRIIAKKIKALTGEDPLQITDKQTGAQRAAQYSDIVLLSRAASTVAQLYVDELKSFGIPAYCAEQKSFFEAPEIKVVTALLNSIDNPRNDIPFIAVLRSPIVGLVNDELLLIRNCDGGECSFYDSLLFYIEHSQGKVQTQEQDQAYNPSLLIRLKQFLAMLLQFQKMALYKPINELLSALYHTTGYYDMVGLMPGGNIRQNNLLVLMEYAVNFEQSSYAGLFHFIRYIDRIKKSGKLGIGQAKGIGENDNTVRIMTIHKSKGLEFPIVFLSALSKRFNFRDLTAPVLMDQDLGLGPDYVDYEKRTTCKTLNKSLLARKKRGEIVAEEMRILYVAMTRAKEKLFLVGSVVDMEKHLNRWRTAGSGPIPAYYLKKCTNMLDWIMPALHLHPDANQWFEHSSKGYQAPGQCQASYQDSEFTVEWFSRQKMAETATQQKADLKNRLTSLLKESEDDAAPMEDAIVKRLTFTYPFPDMLPSKLSIAEIKMRYQQEAAGDTAALLPVDKWAYEAPEFTQQQSKKVSAAKHGAAVHLLLSKLDFNAADPAKHITALLKELVEKGLLLEKEAASIPVSRILTFLSLPICDQIRSSSKLYRETPFVIALSPGELGIQSNADADSVLVHGIIDCFFQTPEGIVLIDYKTGTMKGSVSAYAQQYQTQMQIYRKAIQHISAEEPAHSYLYFFSRDQLFEMTDES